MHYKYYIIGLQEWQALEDVQFIKRRTLVLSV
jgi:hypothetical protein